MASQARESRRPHDTPFKQQRLKAWQPILTPYSVITVFVGIAIVFIPIGAAILSASSSVIDVGPIRYDEISDSTDMHVKFTWPETTSNKVYLYYQLSNFYQNHRRYVKSRSDTQLSGTTLSDKQTLGDCDPWETFADHLPNTADDFSFNTTDLSSIKLNPCGLIANSKFNDTFELFRGECTSDPCSDDLTSSLRKKGISWSSDRKKKFKNIEGFNGPSLVQQADVEDEDFIVWMRTAGLPTFKKLHRIIDGGLEKGVYTIRIDQNFPVKDFDGEKAFYLTTTTWIGGKNEFLGWAYVIVGLVCLVLALLFFIKHKINPRPLGDPRSMREWKR